jgi:hypothetical protein
MKLDNVRLKVLDSVWHYWVYSIRSSIWASEWSSVRDSVWDFYFKCFQIHQLITQKVIK